MSESNSLLLPTCPFLHLTHPQLSSVFNSFCTDSQNIVRIFIIKNSQLLNTQILIVEVDIYSPCLVQGYKTVELRTKKFTDNFFWGS